ncbi:LLM class F420-dependent oxidoreductase [Jatrophihabitans sp. DSM 45814]
MVFEELGKVGVWRAARQLSPELARSIESLGYGTLWIGGSPDGTLNIVEEILDATTTLTVATGVVNTWKDDASTVAASYHRINARHRHRFLLGIGVGHPEATGERYQRPFEALVHYLDELDQAQVPVSSRVLAALGPRVLKLSAERSAGAHPYLTTPEHTRQAREILGPNALLAPEQKVVLETDPDQARLIGRPVVEPYLNLVNYTNNLRSIGFTHADLADGGSDRLIDALVRHGDAATVAAGLREHLAAGADQVVLQLLTPFGADPVPGYAALAAVLLG